MKHPDLRSWAAELEHLADHLGRAGPDEICCAALTSRQCSLLRTLRGGQGKRLSDLAAAAGITPSAMTRVLEKLEARQLVRRARSRAASRADAGAAAFLPTMSLAPSGTPRRRLPACPATWAWVAAIPSPSPKSLPA